VKDADAEIKRLAKKLPSTGPAPKTTYEAVITAVHDTDDELEVDLGGWPASIVLGGDDDARYNPPDADGKVKTPSQRYAVGDVLAVQLAPAAAAKSGPAAAIAAAAEKAEDPNKLPEPIAKHQQHRVVFEPGPQGAVVILDVKTRKVLALVGGYTTRIGGFDRATQAHRQAGSSFKPFVYAAAIDEGKATPARVVNDAPEVFDLWRPKNFETTFEGPVRLRTALARSINTVAIRVAYEVGPDNVAATAAKLGVKSELPKELSIALGAGAVTPLEMTDAFASILDGGIYLPPRFIDAIDRKPEAAVAGVQALRPEVAYVVADMMRSVVTEGTAAAAASLKIPLAGKTGTSNDAKDTWFIGGTPDLVVGVWIGYDDDRPIAREQGASTALPVFIDIMKALDLPAKAFPRPAHVVEATIDKASGLLAPADAPKGTAMTEVFVEGTAPTETAAQPGEVTETNMVTDEYKEQ
jgi:penicillin-binding protein 1A